MDVVNVIIIIKKKIYIKKKLDLLCQPKCQECRLAFAETACLDGLVGQHGRLFKACARMHTRVHARTHTEL